MSRVMSWCRFAVPSSFKTKKVLLKMGVSAPRSKMRPDQVVYLVLLLRRLKQLIWCRSLGQRHEAAANSGLGSTLPAR